jgi:hypothetical protein
LQQARLGVDAFSLSACMQFCCPHTQAAKGLVAHRLTLRERRNVAGLRLNPIWSGGETIVANLHRSVSKRGYSVKKLLLSFAE